jgi:hypothetical protein
MTAMADVPPDDSSVNGRNDLFVIGAGQSRVTLYSQQVRALNLADHLRDRLLKESVVVIGAGAAGLTFAAAASVLGARRVTLLDQAEQMMSFQRGSRQRFLHPHISEWPEVGCWKMSAGLPLLTWDEGTASDVAVRITSQFEEAFERNPENEIFLRAMNVRVELEPRLTVTWECDGTRKEETPGIVILAVGFGIERTVPGVPLLSYWRDDSLEQPAFLSGAGPHIQVVSGDGDGALIDVLRASLWDFEHGSFLTRIAAVTRGTCLEEQERAVERTTWAADGDDLRRSILANHYASLDEQCPGAIKQLDEMLHQSARRNYRIRWLHKARLPWNPQAQSLHRVLVSRLVRMEKAIVTPIRGDLLRVEPRVFDRNAVKEVNRKVRSSTVEEATPLTAWYENAAGECVPLEAHGVTVRHGAYSAREGLKQVWELLSEAQQGRRKGERRPMRPIPGPWQRAGTFAASGSPSSQSQSEAPALHVRLTEDPTPRDRDPRGRPVYRLVLSVADAPRRVKRLTYDLHPRDPEEGGRKECTALRGYEREREFLRLVHTSTDYNVRVRMDDGGEIEDRIVCGLCRHYGTGSEESLDDVARSLSPTSLCKRPGGPLADCLLSELAAGELSH